MSNVRSRSMILILLCSAFSIVTGRLLDQSSGAGTSNYRAVYYGARCIIQQVDPYNPDEFSRVYMAENGALPRDPVRRPLFLRAVMVCVNLPTTLFLLIPLALLSWGLSHLLWLVLIGMSLTVAAVLIYDLAFKEDSRLPSVLICFMMANSQVLFTVANTAGIAVGLCAISVWCFVRQRFSWLGIIMLAISLAIKPHDSGLVWLWLLVSGGIYRKRALQTALIVAAIAIPAVLVVAHTSPNWRTELIGNLAATSAHGDISDPGPASSSRQGSADIIIDLQTLLSLIRDDPNFYNLATYSITGSLLVFWLFTALRHNKVSSPNYFGLAFIAGITMLVSYHRPYDAKLLMLVLPAIAQLQSIPGIVAPVGATITTAAIVSTSDLPIAIHSLVVSRIRLTNSSIAERILEGMLTRPAPIFLLALTAFYFYVYLRWEGKGSDTREGAAW